MQIPPISKAGEVVTLEVGVLFVWEPLDLICVCLRGMGFSAATGFSATRVREALVRFVRAELVRQLMAYVNGLRRRLLYGCGRFSEWALVLQ